MCAEKNKMLNVSSGNINIIDKELINKSINNVLKNNNSFYSYSTPKGLKELRNQISGLLSKTWKQQMDSSNMLITSGSQQSINLIISALLSAGDCVLIEQPTYYGAIKCFNNHNIKMVGVKLENNGLDLVDLERKIIEHKPKLIYVVPTFNNPTGYAWSNKNRLKFLKIINKYNVMVIEDDPYSLINFTSTRFDSLYKLNNGKNIIYLGTFSKYICPSINVGYIIASKDKIDLVYPHKESSDLGTSLFTQTVILDFLKNNDICTVVKNKIPQYKLLLKNTINMLNKQFSQDIIDISIPKGGLFILVKFNKNMDKVLPHKEYFYIDDKHNNEIRVNICYALNTIQN